jgi:hypothetical protein
VEEIRNIVKGLKERKEQYEGYAEELSRPGLKLSHKERKDERRDTIQRGV